jgi:carbon starvation protein
LAHASRYGDALRAGALLAPAKTAGAMRQIVANDGVDVTLTVLFMVVVMIMLAAGARACWRAAVTPRVTVREDAHDMSMLRQNA